MAPTAHAQTRRSRHIVLLAAALLAACQSSGRVGVIDGWQLPELSGTESRSDDPTGADPHDPPTTAPSNDTPSSGQSTLVDDDGSEDAPTTPESGGAATASGDTGNTDDTRGGESGDDPASAVLPTAIGTVADSTSQATLPRDNPSAGDLLDHWGHRHTRGVTAGLSLTEHADGGDAAGLHRIRTAAHTSGEAPVVPDLQDRDEVRILGAHRGVTYGRWTGGPADTLSIEFDLSEAGPPMRDDPGFLAMLERAGKAWSHGIADTWNRWVRDEGALKGWLIDGLTHREVRVGRGGEVSTGVEIAVADAIIPGDVGGWANSGVQRPDGPWEPRFGSIEIDTSHLREASEASLFHTLTHEIGHILGAWQGESGTGSYFFYTDPGAGTWLGPNVVSVHGGPAPFQDRTDPHAWHDGQRDPLAPHIDFNHSGVCASIMAYCGYAEALRPILPHAIDFAFLADLGVTLNGDTGRPETYGLAGWTDYAGFTLAVSRDLRVTLADPQPYYDGAANHWRALDVTDLVQVDADAFGHRTTGAIGTSLAREALSGRVRYSGGLIGAATQRDGMPPVTGDATLSVDLGTLDGAASFTSLALHTGGAAETFAGGVLHYPFALSDNAITGTQAESTLLADFYGPRHEDVAGTLHDPRAGLLASFGATRDHRPEREEVIASASYLAGLSVHWNASDEADNGWFWYRCQPGASCEVRDTEANYWNDWTAGTREHVLASTAGWALRAGATPVADRGFVRVTRQTAASTDGAQGRHVVDEYMGTMEHSAFGTGFERFSSEWTNPTGTPGGPYTIWTGVQGAVSDRLPDARAQWSGVMLGLDREHGAGEHPFVEGVATVDYFLATNRMHVSFTEVASRDRQRTFRDFGFRNLEPHADGTFADGGSTGILNGAFFGPANEEVGGMFNHSTAKVLGSFGARAVPDTVTLEETGTVGPVSLTTDDSGAQVPLFRYDDWGIWGRQYSADLFGALIEQNVTQSGDTTTYWTPTTHISGTPTGSNPVTGGAVWTGDVRAFDTGHGGYLPVRGDARLEVDFDHAEIDVAFSGFDEGYDDMSWSDLQLSGGTFQDTRADATIEGAFYGSDHGGAAGTFERDSLRGVFGAARD